MGKTMWFLIKGSVWLSLGLVVLSFFNTQSNDAASNRPNLQITDTFSAAGEAYRYVSAICIEKPDVCEKGVETFTALGHRAREGARVAFEFLDKQFAEDNAETFSQPELAAPATAVDAATETDGIMTGTVVPLPQKKPAL